MAKQKQFDFTLGTLVTRTFRGNSIFWGHGSDYVGVSTDSTKSTADNNDLFVDGKKRDGAVVDVQMARLIMKFDLSSLPLNAVIASASLQVYFRGFQVKTNIFPITFGVYRVFPVVDTSDATMRYSNASSVEWTRYGMVDGDDYKAAEEATAVVNAAEAPHWGSPSSGDELLLKTFDITNFAKYTLNTDARQMYALLARSNAHRRLFTTLDGNPVPDVGGVYDGYITLWNTVSTQAVLTVTYTDALTFHPAFADGTIDAATIIDTTSGGIYLFDAVRVGGVGTSKKFWVKNNLASSAVNLAVFSQRSYGSKIPDMTRTTVGTGTISDITTVDKSINPTNYTKTEKWRIVLTAATTFNVFHDNGSFDDPTVVDAWTAASPSGGTVGTPYTDTATGVAFTLTAGGTAFVSSDEIIFRTFEDDAHPAAPTDSDSMLLVAPDATNTPGNFRPMPWKPCLVTGVVATDTVVPVSDVTLFKAGMQVQFTSRSTGSSLGTRIVQTVGVSTITLTANISLSNLDYVEGVRVGESTIAAGGTFPFWIEPSVPAAVVRETKFPRWRAFAE